MARLETLIGLAARMVCASLLVGACMWTAGTVGDVPQAALAGQYLVQPFLGLFAAYILLTVLGMLASLPILLARAVLRWWRHDSA